MLLRLPPRREPGLASLLALLLGALAAQQGHGGFGALLTGVMIAGRGAWEPGQVARLPLALAVLLLTGAGLWDAGSLPLWAELRRWTGLGPDAASLAVDATEQVLRLLAWVAAATWALAPRPQAAADP